MTDDNFPLDLLTSESDSFNQTSIELNDFQTMVDQTLLDAVEQDQSSQTGNGELTEKSSDRYHLMDTLGEGAMGMILLAQDKLLARKVAYKHVREEYASQPQMLNRFYKEAQITSQLEHPGIIPVYSMEQMSDKSLAYAMKWLKGSTLKEEIQAFKQRVSKPAPDLNWSKEYRALLNIFLIVCDTLHYAHSKGIVHRDLKPSNIMLGKYHEVYVLDWGIAALSGSGKSLDDELDDISLSTWNPDNEERTQLGKIVGTPRYMSPEQARGDAEALLPASDQYALGLILYEITCLKPAYSAGTLKELLDKVAKNQHSPCSTPQPQIKIPLEIQAILNKVLSTRANDRYASVTGLTEDIRAFLQDQPTQVFPDNLWRKSLRWTRKHPQTSLLMMTALILLSGLITSTSLYLNQQVLEKNRIRQKALNTLLTETTLTARGVDSHLSQFESLLERLVARSLESDLRGSERNLAPPKISHIDPDYTQGSWSPLKPVPGRVLSVFEGQAKIQAQALNTETNPLDLLHSGSLKQSPLKWSTVVFENRPNQIQLIYPGTQNMKPIQALFRQGLRGLNSSENKALHNAYGPLWGKPQKELLLVYQALYSEKQQYRGWAGLAIEHKELKSLLKQANVPGLKNIQLLSEDLHTELYWSKNGLTPTSFPGNLATRIIKNSGYFERGADLYAYQKLGTLPWILMLKVDRAVLLMESQHES